jgi:phytoene/squalene synthetase
MDYCRRSANPIGRLVLQIAGYRDQALERRSDAICTALQLTNFWQDLAIDFSRGRVYMPQEEMRAHGAREDDLGGRAATEAWKRAVASAVRRTRDLFDTGRPLCNVLPGRLGLELRATWLGGRRVLEHLERRSFDPLAQRPRLSFADVPWFAWRLATWSARPANAGRRREGA